MTEQNWVTLTTIQGELQAEIMRGLLEAQGISVRPSQEGIARVYGFSVGPLAEVDLLVPEEELVAAQTVIADFQAGIFEELGDQLDAENAESEEF
ncbi:MAG TPA: hypothetical protein DEH25_12275 [Chloroflexi bacterium]|nr:hypothetical protein [Chloroflexota bacterium]HBY06924.1 hypothetical protein [Chloroflexota bacterium]